VTTLIACFSVGKGTWNPVHRLITSGSFDKVILVTNELTKDKYPDKDVPVVSISTEKPVQENVDFLIRELKPLISDLEVGVNLISGTGTEHMVILAALLKLGVGVRLVTWGEQGLVELDV
jgi:hypothetical protein